MDKRLTHPAIVDAVLVRYLQNDGIVDKPIDKSLIQKSLLEYRQSCDRFTFIKMTAWVMRSTSGSIFIDSNENVHTGTIRTWLTKSGLYLTRVATAKRKPSDNYDTLSKGVGPGDPVCNADLLKRLKKLGVVSRFPDAITAGEYQNFPDYELPNSQRTSPSVSILGEQKISNLSPTAKVLIDNSSLFEKSDDELKAIEAQLDYDEYIDLIAQFAQSWRNVSQES